MIWYWWFSNCCFARGTSPAASAVCWPCWLRRQQQMGQISEKAKVVEVRIVNINLEHWRVCCLCFQQLLQSCHGWHLSPAQYINLKLIIKSSFVSDLWQRPKLKRWRWCKRFPAATKKWCFFFIFLFHFGHFPYLSQHLPPGLCLSGSLRFCLCSSPGSTF